jgi:hypothetical protein
MSSIKVIGNEIYVYPNFLSKKEIKKILLKLNSFKDEDWKKEESFIPKISPFVKDHEIIIDKIKKNIIGFDPDEPSSFVKLVVGDAWGVHADNFEYSELREKSKKLKDGEPFSLVENIAFGLVVYINDDYEGGEIFYPDQNIIYKPKSGDLVIHSAEEFCRHGVKKIISGTRYSYSSNLHNMVKVPLN